MVLFGKRSFNKGRNDLKLVTYYIPQVLFNKKNHNYYSYTRTPTLAKTNQHCPFIQNIV